MMFRYNALLLLFLSLFCKVAVSMSPRVIPDVWPAQSTQHEQGYFSQPWRPNQEQLKRTREGVSINIIEAHKKEEREPHHQANKRRSKLYWNKEAERDFAQELKARIEGDPRKRIDLPIRRSRKPRAENPILTQPGQLFTISEEHDKENNPPRNNQLAAEATCADARLLLFLAQSQSRGN